MIKSLRRRFILISMCSIALVLLLIIGSINISNYMNIGNSMEIRLDFIANNGGSFPERQKIEPPIDGSLEIPEDAADFFKNNEHFGAEAPYDTRYFTVTMKEDGTVESINTGRISAIDTKDAVAYAEKLFSQNKSKGYVDSYIYKRYDTKDSSGKITYLYVFVDCERELNTFYSFAFASIGISLAGLLLVFILVFFFSKMVTKPMAESYEKQKRFITDASHELKTPLTIIDANTEIIEMTAGESEWTQSTRNQVKRLASLTDKLVLLSRMDEENHQLEKAEFSLSDAVLDTVEPFISIAQTRDITLTVRVAPDINYYGDEKGLRQLVSLLMDNAFKYCSGDGIIEVALMSSGKYKVLSVSNSLEKIAPGKHNEFFERFYRADSSHNSKTGGFGIGLSVVYAIASAHKGSISAYSEDDKSIKFTLSLP